MKYQERAVIHQNSHQGKAMKVNLVNFQEHAFKYPCHFVWLLTMQPTPLEQLNKVVVSRRYSNSFIDTCN
eukprot:455690-Amphidinium_carterae.1